VYVAEKAEVEKAKIASNTINLFNILITFAPLFKGASSLQGDAVSSTA
jgi:hypothetical protein